MAAGEAPTRHLWLPQVAPMSLLISGTMFAVLMITLATLLVIRGPWLGVQLEPDNDGLQVIHVHPTGPSAEVLLPGMVISALHASGQPLLDLTGYHPNLEPHAHSEFEGYDNYIEETGKIWPYLQASSLTLVLTDGAEITLAPFNKRPLNSLPVNFWLFHLFGTIALLISLGVWAFRRGQAATRLYFLAGLGFFIATWSNSLYLPRELTFAPDLFVRLGALNHSALYLMLGSLLGLLMYFPRRLFPPVIRYVLLATALIMAATLANEQVHIVKLPLHDFYFPVLLCYLAGVAVATWQWRAARGRPLDRAALRWFFLSLFISTGMGLIVYFIPAFSRIPGTFAQVAMIGFACSMYVGLALGILRYRLFDLELWWFRAWLWFFGGLAVLLVDAAVVFLFGLQPAAALGIAVLAVGWVYFPIRQWVWGNLATTNQMRLEDHLPTLAGALLTSQGTADTAQQWRQVLMNVFSPLDIRRVPPLREPVLIEQGARMQVPVPSSDYGLELTYSQHGARLFNRRDLELTRAMLSLTVQAGQIRAAHETGAQKERRRIMRDLHDDVGARILSLIHGAEEPHQEKLARAALQALRESIYALDEEMRANLAESAQEWKLEVKERLQPLDMQLHWLTDSLPATLSLTARQTINIKRILHEAVSNALIHARPQHLTIKMNLTGQYLVLQIDNDGTRKAQEDNEFSGRGLHNMRTRAEELGGTLQADFSETGYRVILQLPINTNTEAAYA